MEVPQLKRELAINWCDESMYTIIFYATSDAAEEIKQFGQLTPNFCSTPNLYHLAVDKRYDFQEVLEYLKQY